jgi:hypothetical protein
VRNGSMTAAFRLAVALVGAGALAACGAVGETGGKATGAGAGARESNQIEGVAASCAALTPAQQFKAARVVFDGTTLNGPTVRFDGRRVLSSPARVRVSRYLKGHGPAVVRVETGSAAAPGGVVVNEDGIQPVVGQRWRIYADMSRQPFATSICSGTRLLVDRTGAGSRADE